MPHKSLKIECANAHKVEVRLDIRDPKANKFAVLLPGKGYRVTDPIFYFLSQFLIEQQFNLIAVDYAYDQNQAFETASLDDKLDVLIKDAATIGNAVADLIEDGDILLIGKSLGTIILSQLTSNPAFKNAQLAWLTPPLGLAPVDQSIIENATNSFICIGTNDPSYNQQKLDEFAQQGVTNCIIDGVAHVLEAENNVPKSILAHHQMLTAFSNWLNR